MYGNLGGLGIPYCGKAEVKPRCPPKRDVLEIMFLE